MVEQAVMDSVVRIAAKWSDGLRPSHRNQILQDLKLRWHDRTATEDFSQRLENPMKYALSIRPQELFLSTSLWVRHRDHCPHSHGLCRIEKHACLHHATIRQTDDLSGNCQRRVSTAFESLPRAPPWGELVKGPAGKFHHAECSNRVWVAPDQHFGQCQRQMSQPPKSPVVDDFAFVFRKQNKRESGSGSNTGNRVGDTRAVERRALTSSKLPSPSLGHATNVDYIHQYIIPSRPDTEKECRLQIR